MAQWKYHLRQTPKDILTGEQVVQKRTKVQSFRHTWKGGRTTALQAAVENITCFSRSAIPAHSNRDWCPVLQRTIDKKLKLQRVPTKAIGKELANVQMPLHFFLHSEFQSVSELARNGNPRTEFDGVLNIFIGSL